MSVDTENPDDVWEAAREFLLRESAPGSDAGLTLAQWDSINAGILSFAERAKLEALTMSEAEQTVSQSQMRCEGLTGTHGGIIGASFASVLPFLHGDNPFTWIYYLLPGPVMDLAFRYLPRYANKLWFMVLLGGFAHMTKPIGSFRFGVVYPFASHLLFGVIGGLLGALVVLGIRHASKKSS